MTESEAISIDERLLPPQLRLLMRAIGAAQSLKLLRKRGGIRLQMPKGAHQRCPVLEEILGADDAAKVIQAFAGRQEIFLPKADKMVAQLRNLVIRAEASSKSLMQQALEHDLTTRQVWNIRGGSEASNRSGEHPDLFESPQHARNGI